MKNFYRCEVYECPICYTLHKSQKLALNCCTHKMKSFKGYECKKCGNLFTDVFGKDDCCGDE